MTFSQELYFLTLTAAATALMWIPYTMARIFTRGSMATFANPDPSHPADPAWAERARSAHANAVENLVVFAPLVIIAALIGISTPATVFASKAYFTARLVHFFVYAAGIPVIRTLAFFAGFGATMVFVVALLTAHTA
jgi:uncharacterized MAPEG superfamily protein